MNLQDIVNPFLAKKRLSNQKAKHIPGRGKRDAERECRIIETCDRERQRNSVFLQSVSLSLPFFDLLAIMKVGKDLQSRFQNERERERKEKKRNIRERNNKEKDRELREGSEMEIRERERKARNKKKEH